MKTSINFLIAVCAIIVPSSVFANALLSSNVIDKSESIQGSVQDSGALVIIDTSVEHVLELLPGINPAAKVALLDTNRDPVAQITEILSGHKGLSSLHIFSHGASGRLLLGDTELSMKTLGIHEQALTRWASSLSAGADVYLYGCELASGDGEKFVKVFSEIIGADVAASNDITASASNGGDWDLEVSTGSVIVDGIIKPAAFEASSVVLELPAGFTNELVIQNLNQPVSIETLPSGEMLILERAGTILIMDPTQPLPQASAYLTLPNVDSDGEKGLLEITLDADFANNKYFYLYYHNSEVDRARISRFIHHTDHADLLDEVVVWEDNLTTGLQIISDHWGGGLDVGPDGYLYFTIGDKKDYPEESQDLTLTAGKLIRINPSFVDTLGGWVQGGDNAHLIPADNPFIDGPGGNLDEIWGLGLRNPFRARWDIPTGRFFIGEVGGNVNTGPDVSYEDLHMATLDDAGANFGWPMCEGPNCYEAEPLNYSPPIFTNQHNDSRAIMAGMVYRGNLYPVEYQEAFFFADFGRGWLRYLTFDADGSLSADVPYGGFVFSGNAEMQDPVALEVGPEGAIYYCSITEGHIGRFMFNSGNQPPVINQSTADITSAPTAPATVNFVGAATDLENDPISYLWDFGDGVQSTSSSVAHSYTEKGIYTARLSVSDSLRSTLSDPIFIEIGQPPVLAFDEPIDGQIFRAGDVIPMKGSATDSDGLLTNDSLKWKVEFKHDDHLHPIIIDEPGASCMPAGSSCFSFTVPSTSHGFSGDTGFKITLTVTDADGLVRSQSVSIVPDKVALTINSNVPGGVSVTMNQLPRTGPLVVDALIGFQHSIEVPTTVIASGYQYVFDSWSNGVTDVYQIITVPDIDTVYTANYTNIGLAPRVSDGLQVLYAFEAGAGETVYDLSGVGEPLDLNINNPADVTWQTGALRVDQSTLITSAAASTLNEAIISTNEITLEAWLIPANSMQTGPARIVSISQSSTERNMTLGQGGSGGTAGDRYDVRLRTTTTGTNGSNPSLSSSADSLNTDLMHVVYTRDASGNANIYLDSVLSKSGLIDGDLSNWASDTQLGLANEVTGDRPWLGTFDLVAIYNRALTAVEIGHNFNQGPDSTTGRIPPLGITVFNLPNMLLGANYNQSVSASGGIAPYSWTLDTGILPEGLSFDPVTGIVSGVPMEAGSYDFILKVTDAAGAMATQSFSVSVLLDTDSDGLADVDEVNIYGTDPAIADTDNDGLSDGDEVNTYLTDPTLVDSDGDGLNDGDEVSTHLTNPLSKDTDGDGLLDNFEVIYSFNPLLTGEELLDGDSDGLSNLEEQVAGTSPLLSDSDNDGLTDGDEVNTYLTDPLSNDTDADGLLDNFEVIHGFNPLLIGEETLDGDVDGLNNLAEQAAGTSPSLADTDSDGLTDGDEVNVYDTNPLFINILGDLAPRGAPDGEINAGDVLVLSRIVLGQIAPDNAEILLGDINQDGELNVGDIVLLINIALGITSGS